MDSDGTCGAVCTNEQSLRVFGFKTRLTRTSDAVRKRKRHSSRHNTPRAMDNVTKCHKRVRVDVNPSAGKIINCSVASLCMDCEAPQGRLEHDADVSSTERALTKDTVESGGNMGASNGKGVAKHAVRGKTERKPLTLEKFDGSAPLEIFLAKFHNCLRYKDWSADEHAIFLRDCLLGNANQILLEIPDDAGDDEIIRLL